MKNFFIFLWCIFILPSSFAQAMSEVDCLLALNFQTGLNDSHQVTETYVRLFRQLALTKNAINAVELEHLATQTEPVNPISFSENTLSPSERFSFQRAFALLLEKKDLLDWPTIREEIKSVLREKEAVESHREESENQTVKVWFPVVKAKAPSVSGLSEVMGSFAFPDETLFVITKVYRFHHGDTYWGIDLSNGVTRDLFNCDALQDQFLSHTAKNGQTFLSFTAGTKLTVVIVNADHRITVLKSDASFSEAQIFNERYHMLAIREGDAGEINLLLEFIQNGQIISLQEMSLNDGKLNLLQKGKGAGSIRSTLVTDSGELVDIQQRGQKVTFRNRTRRKRLTSVTLPRDYILHPAGAIAPAPDKMFIPYHGPNDTRGWFDISSRWLSPGKSRVNDKQMLHVKQFGETYVADLATQFRQVEIFRGAKVETYSVPREIDSTRAKILKTKEGASYLVIGSNSNRLVKEKTYLVLLNLETMVERIVNLHTKDFPQFQNIFETKEGSLEILQDSLKGFEHVQIYGPLSGKVAP